MPFEIDAYDVRGLPSIRLATLPPPVVAPAAYTQALADLTTACALLADTAQAEKTARVRLDRAQADDVAETAIAFGEGRGDPGNAHERAALDALATAERRAAAARIRYQTTVAAYADALDDCAGEWAATLEREAVGALRAAATELDAIRAKVATVVDHAGAALDHVALSQFLRVGGIPGRWAKYRPVVGLAAPVEAITALAGALTALADRLEHPAEEDPDAAAQPVPAA